jgi:hypothetical protein
MTASKFSGYRNVFLIVFFLLWASLQTWMFEPPDGKWEPALVNSVAAYFGVVGVSYVGMILGRAANKWAEKPSA